MEFKCCDALLHKLAINPDNVNFCCSPYDNKLRFMEDYDGSLIDWDEYTQKRTNYLEMFKSGHLPEACNNCSHVEQREWDETIGFNFISISTRTKCSCNCVYCVQSKGDAETKKYLNAKECWDILPVLNELKNRNLILPGCIFIIGGGEPTEFPPGELEALLYMGLMTKSEIVVLTNSIIYNENIAKTISVAKSELKVSVDAGTAETFEKIKRVKAFDTVWKNLAKYVKATKNNPMGRVQIKYIIVPGINDGIGEAKAFIKRCFDIGCRHVEIAIEYDWYGENADKPISDTLRETIRYFNSLSQKGVFFGDARDWFKKQL